MATNARGHTIPAAGETPSRAAIFAPLLTVNDIVMATNATDRAQKITALAPSAARPLYIHQIDNRCLWMHDGTTLRLMAWPSAGAATAAITTTSCGPTDTKNAEITGYVVPVGASHRVEVTFTGFVYNGSSSGQMLVKFRLNGTDVGGGIMNYTYGGTLGDRRTIDGLSKVITVPPGTHSISVWTGAAGSSVAYDTQYLNELSVKDLGPVVT